MAKKKATKAHGGPGRLTMEEAARVEERLLDAAQELFSEHSFSQTSMEQIARHAGASTKTLYSRYPDKAAVIRAVVERLIARYLAAAAQVAPLDATQSEPRSFITALATHILTGINGEAAGMIRIALSEARRFPVIAEHYNAVLARGRGIFRQALEQWHQAGLMPDLKDPAMAATLLISMLTDLSRIRVAMGEPMSAAEISAHVGYATDLFLRGVGYRPKAA